MNERSNLIYEAADLYYMRQLTVEAVATHLGVSRATVSRLLKTARETGVVQIRLNDNLKPKSQLSETLSRRYRVNILVVNTTAHMSPISRNEAVSREGARLFDSLIDHGSIAGVAWGATVTEVAKYLPTRPLKDVVVVQLNGAGNARHTGIPYSGSILGSVAQAYSAQMIHFPVPAFFDRATTKEAMWQERSIRGVLQVQQKADVALFGIGAFGGAIPSHVYTGGYFDGEEQACLRTQGVVGDMCTVLLRADGTHSDLEVNARATGPVPAELAKIRRRIAVVSGNHKLKALKGALTTGAITDLVLDTQLAQGLIDQEARN